MISWAFWSDMRGKKVEKKCSQQSTYMEIGEKSITSKMELELRGEFEMRVCEVLKVFAALQSF